MKIDIQRLREDMKKECLGAYFGGGYGAALVESFNIEKASPQKLVEMAQRKRIDLRKYAVDND